MRARFYFRRPDFIRLPLTNSPPVSNYVFQESKTKHHFHLNSSSAGVVDRRAEKPYLHSALRRQIVKMPQKIQVWGMQYGIRVGTMIPYMSKGIQSFWLSWEEDLHPSKVIKRKIVAVNLVTLAQFFSIPTRNFPKLWPIALAALGSGSVCPPPRNYFHSAKKEMMLLYSRVCWSIDTSTPSGNGDWK